VIDVPAPRHLRREEAEQIKRVARQVIAAVG
jgi:hypothetical protein